MIGSVQRLQKIVPCVICAGLFILISMRTCNGMPVDISTERLSESFLPPESSEAAEVRFRFLYTSGTFLLFSFVLQLES
jgi:hypothetical protein